MEYLLNAWPGTQLILFTLTPCGPVAFANETADESGSIRKARRATSVEACEWIATFNTVVYSLVQRHGPRARLLDAHQMTTSRPGTELAGYPPGVWTNERAGIHFEHTFTRKERDAARRLDPPSAAGEMNRALANRVLDMICPADVA